MCAYQGVRIVSLSENYAYVLNGCFLNQTLLFHHEKQNVYCKREGYRMSPKAQNMS